MDIGYTREGNEDRKIGKLERFQTFFGYNVNIQDLETIEEIKGFHICRKSG